MPHNDIGPRLPGTNGRPPRHGGEFDLKDPATWPAPAVTTRTATASYGEAEATAWNRLHPRLTHRGAWLDHDGPLPIIEGALIRLVVEHLPGDRQHTFRLLKQTLGWTRPKIRTPDAADRWTWLLIAAHTQLRLARPLAEDLRRPWERPAAPERLTPARVRRGFSEPTPEHRPASKSSETRPTRPRTPTRIEESTSRDPLPRRQDRRTREEPDRATTAARLRTGSEHVWELAVADDRC
jgi:hypothetical protein